MNVEYLSIIFVDYFTLRNLFTSLHFVQTRYAAPTVHSYLMEAEKTLLHINEEQVLIFTYCEIMTNFFHLSVSGVYEFCHIFWWF